MPIPLSNEVKEKKLFAKPVIARQMERPLRMERPSIS